MTRTRRWILVAAAGVVSVGSILVPILVAQAQLTFVVNTTADPVGGSCSGGTGSLRQCIAAATATAGGTVTFAVNGVFTLIQGQLPLSTPMTIQGNGPAQTIIDGNQADRVLEVGSSGVLTLSGVTIRNGRSDGAVSSSEGAGGGVLNLGTLTLTGSAVSGNTATWFSPTTSTSTGGGGIFSAGPLTVTDSTISGNTVSAQSSGSGTTAFAQGGGLFTTNGTTLNLTNSTISGNLAIATGIAPTGRGGGVFSASTAGQATNVTVTANTASVSSGVDAGGGWNFVNSIVADNTGSPNCRHAGPEEVAGSVGYNLDNDSSCFTLATDIHAEPLLQPLADNGGGTLTHALSAASPAIDGVGAGCPPPATDQRGVARPQGARCDIGAFESSGTPPPPPSTTTTTSASTTTTTSASTTTTTSASTTTTTTIPSTTTTSVVPTTTTSTTTTTAGLPTTTTTSLPTITCFVSALRAAPPKQQDVTVQSSAGLASISNIRISNGSVFVPTFTPGTQAPVIVTATKNNQSQATTWSFDATNTTGFTQHCG